MTHCSQGLHAGEPVLLTSGRSLLVIERTRMTVLDVGGWRGVVALREPHALLLRGADGSFSVHEAGSGPVSMAELSEVLPRWEQVLSTLASSNP